MTLVRCPTCHREERWEADRVHVLIEGGARRPREHVALASWRILRRAREQATGPVVGACSSCALPMVADGPGPAPLSEWVLATPGGELRVGAELVGPQGVISADDAEAWLVQQVRAPLVLRPGLWAFQAAWFGILLAPVALWLVAVYVLGLFLSGLVTGQMGG